MVPVPIMDLNKQAHSYTNLQIDRLYIVLNSETYISLRHQELRTGKNITYEFYCEELFIVKNKSKYSCKCAKYFNLGSEIIKEIAILCITLIKLTSNLQYSMAVMKLFWQTVPTVNTLNAI